MTDAFDGDGVDGSAGKGGEKDAAKGVAKGEAEATLQGFHDNLRIVFVLVIDGDVHADLLKGIGKLDFFDGIGSFDVSHLYMIPPNGFVAMWVGLKTSRAAVLEDGNHCGEPAWCLRWREPEGRRSEGRGSRIRGRGRGP